MAVGLTTENEGSFDVMFLLSTDEQLNIIYSKKDNLHFELSFLAKGRKIYIYRLELALNCFKAETAFVFLFEQIETPFVCTSFLL